MSRRTYYHRHTVLLSPHGQRGKNSLVLFAFGTALVASEILPFVADVRANGVLEALLLRFASEK